MRGKLVHAFDFAFSKGNIPAYAGKTLIFLVVQLMSGTSPRMRGKH